MNGSCSDTELIFILLALTLFFTTQSKQSHHLESYLDSSSEYNALTTFKLPYSNTTLLILHAIEEMTDVTPLREATKINQIYLETYRKFLRAIDHMEFHPTLGRAKTGSTIRLKRQPKSKDKTIKASQYINQMEGLTKEDKLMLRQADELIETKFLNKTTKKRRNKRFGLAGWIMGWGIGHLTSFRAIKNNIRTLQVQNKLQED